MMEFKFMEKVSATLMEGTKRTLKITTPELNADYVLDFSVEKEQVILPLDETLNVIFEPIGKDTTKFGILFREVAGLTIIIEDTANSERMVKAVIEFED